MMKSIRRAVCAASAAVMLLSSIDASAAFNAYLTVQGKKQGTLKGSRTNDPKSSIIVTSFTHGPTSPREMNAGLATGKRQVEPVIISIHVPAANRAQWQAALDTKETLTALKLVAFKPPTPGQSAPVEDYTLVLTDATVSKIEDLPRDPGAPASVTDINLKITFIYRRITITWRPGGKTANDDWSTPGS